MLHPVHASWNPSAEGQPELLAAARVDAVAVSSLQGLALAEPYPPQTVAMSTTPSGLYSMDTAMLAMAFIGAWLVLLGGAMLARQFRLMRSA